MSVRNFFIAGPPVRGEDFFGRKKALQRILLTSQNIIFIGLRRIGKSSLLFQAFKELDTDTDLAVRIDASEYYGRRADDFIWELSRRLSEEIERKPSHMQDKTAKAKKGLIKFAKLGIDRLFEFERLLALVNESGLRIVLLIDEIDSMLHLANEDAIRMAGIIRNLTSSGSLRTICTSCVEPNEIKIAHPGSAWHNIFTTEYLGPFTDDESIEMLSTLSQKSGNSLSEKECRFLMEVFGNFPFFLQTAGVNLMGDGDFHSTNINTRRQAMVEEVRQTVFSLNNYHIQYLMSHLDLDAVTFLKKISQGKKSSSPQEERLFWRLSQFGLIAGTFERPKISSLILSEAINSIQEKSLLDWDKVRDFSTRAFETATTEAIKVAISKYL